MLKPKVIFPDRAKLESPYQLEDCQRRLRDLKKREVRFTQMDTDRVAFCIRRVKTVAVPFPMVAYEIHGTLRRWAGTGTVIDDYRLHRLTVRVDTWVALFVAGSLIVSALLMLPTLLNSRGNIYGLIGALSVGLILSLFPLLTWIQHTRALNIEREIDDTHEAILSALNIED